MALYRDQHIAIYFGDGSDQLGATSSLYDQYHTKQQLVTTCPFNSLGRTMGLQYLVFPKQVHGNQGIVIDASTLHAITPFEVDADYIVTNIARVGLGVLTADCLPIILHDTRNNVIAAIHAGWRSSVQKIVTCALRSMHETYGTQAANIRAFFGPCACTCCYSVGPEMMHHVAPHQDQTIRVSGTTYYFDLARYNQILLCNEGAPPESCCFDYNQCTICNPIFCSYRRQRDRAGRQMSVVALR